MLESLELHNFQSHEQSRIPFSDGVTVIMGKSHSGKSAILRSLRWVVSNTPKGFGFRKHGTEKKTTTNSMLNLVGGVTVARERNATSINQYTLHQQQKDTLVLEALRGTVPDEISNVLNISELNIQSQFAPYFLIGETAGEVARILNKYTGLEVIDTVLKAASGLVLKSSNNITVLETQRLEQQKLCDDLAYVDDLEKKANNLSEVVHKLETLLAWKAELNTLLQQFTDAQNEISALNKVLDQRGVIRKVAALLIDMSKSRTQYTKLCSLSEQIATYTADKQECAKLLKLKKPVALLSSMLAEMKAKQKTASTLQKNVHTLEHTENELSGYMDILESAEDIQNCSKLCVERKEIHGDLENISWIITEHISLASKIKVQGVIVCENKKYLAQIKVCPICNTPIDGIHV